MLALIVGKLLLKIGELYIEMRISGCLYEMDLAPGA